MAIIVYLVGCYSSTVNFFMPQIELEKREIAFLKHLKQSTISFWIDNSGGPSHLCKNSFYGINPKYYFYGSLNEVYYEEQTGKTARRRDGEKINCFDFLEKKIKEEKSNPDGIFVGYFAYDLQDFFFAYFDKCHSRESGNLDRTTCEKQDLDSHFHGNDKTSLHLASNMTDTEYLEKVKQIKEEIKAGNVYQVNLTREYSIQRSATHPASEPRPQSGRVVSGQWSDELDIYLKLRTASPNPYGCYFKTPFVSILSSSPEEFLYIDSQKKYIRTRPIKGTLPFGDFKIDPKNQAENIMIVDLERNDLGRICEYGSVRTKNLLEIESYKHLNHVVSTIEGKLRADIRLRNIFEAMFPGGSITGTPKIAAMKLIGQLEPTRRGAYTGSFGYIKTDGTMNFNILIRTIFSRPIADSPSCRIVSFNVGGGIVADSDPELELQETNLKARGILAALGLKGVRGPF